MSMPAMITEDALYRTSVQNHTAGDAFGAQANGRAILPQFCLSSPCVNIGWPQPICVDLPFFGRRCFTPPSLGSWRITCCTGWWPPIRCSIQQC
jgi:hypothetical protein